jgi:transcription elongation GreA/GreB family factor
VQEAANSETKSVAGDKYETGRAMAHIELEKFAEQLADINHSLEILSQIRTDHRADVVQFGSWVRTSVGDFFISGPIGEVTFNGKKVFLISLASPLARKLVQKRSGESVVVNGRTYLIEEII